MLSFLSAPKNIYTYNQKYVCNQKYCLRPDAAGFQFQAYSHIGIARSISVVVVAVVLFFPPISCRNFRFPLLVIALSYFEGILLPIRSFLLSCFFILLQARFLHPFSVSCAVSRSTLFSPVYVFCNLSLLSQTLFFL